MDQRFYIGSLEIIYHADWKLSLKQFDHLFLQLVLPVKNSIHVDFCWKDALELFPEDTVCAKTDRLLLWQKNNDELRLYLNGEKPPMLVSRLSASRDHIQIMALRDMEEEICRGFRPWFQIHLERLLLWNQALVLHSASIIYRGEAILFTAPSGTGKTTQTDLWHEYREGVSDLNGDRTVLQLTENGWYACGFPIYGSMVRCAQAAMPLRAIVILRQAQKDAVRELSPIEKMTDLYTGCTVMRAYPEDVEETMNLLETLLADVTILELDCTMERSAVDILHEYLYGE